jgi:hypothetical protein
LDFDDLAILPASFGISTSHRTVARARHQPTEQQYRL